MEAHIHVLTEERDRERSELEQLSRIHDSLTKSMNKCVQALDAAHDLVETYRRRYGRHEFTSAVNDAHAALKNQIIRAYTHCILLARQKRQQRLLCQAYQELGDFYLASSCSSSSDVKLAIKNWHECLDNAFGALNAAQSWRDVVARGVKEHAVNGVSGAEQIQGDSLYVTLFSCTALSKLVLHATASNCFQALEYAFMAATIFARLFASSLPHPTRAFLFGSYELGHELWPGRELVGSSEYVSPFELALALTLIPEVLLQYEYYAPAAMPLIAGYEFFARYTLESKSHVANARRLRIEALSQSGRTREALETLSLLFDGVDAVSAREHIKPNAVVPLIAFHDNKPLQDEANGSALAWLTAIDVHRLHADLARSYALPLVLEILLTVLRAVVRLTRHDSNFADGVSPLRAVADKIAQTIMELLEQSLSGSLSPADGHPAPSGALTWDGVHFTNMRSEVVLQQSYLAYLDGQWSLARELSEKAMMARMESVAGTPELPSSSSHPPSSSALVVPLDLDQELKCCLFRRASTFAARCRLRALQCDLAQGHFHAVLEQAAIALLECRASGEAHVSEQIELLQAQALVFLGEREKADVALEQLRVAATTRCTNCSLPFVRVLLTSSTVLRARVLLTPSSLHVLLHTVCDRLVEAERILDELLERDGWIGVSSATTADLSIEKRLNLYNPAVPAFVFVKAALAQTLVECAVDTTSPSPLETMAQRQVRVMHVIDSGLRATLHTTRRVGAAKALLLLLKGAMLKKTLVHERSRQMQLKRVAVVAHKHRHDDPAHHSDTDTAVTDTAVHEMRAQTFADAAVALRESIETSMQRGGYDRRLMRMALMELVDLYSQKLLPGDEDEHTQAVFHYLRLAVATQSHEFTLFETVELQSGTITALEKLPVFITQAIADGEAASTASGTGQAKRTEPLAAQATAMTVPGKKPAAATAGLSAGSTSDPTRALLPDTAHVINYFVRLQREQHVLPVCNDVQHESVQWLHTFLLQHHSSYAKSCCLTDVPSVPTADPEIKASLVCAQWGRDLTPAIAAATTADTDTAPPTGSHLTLYFTLGTTRIEIRCNDAAAATSRMESFLHAPLLSHKPGLDETQVSNIRTALSRLRARMEDDESLVIDRSNFERELMAILRSVQQLLQPNRSAIAPVAASDSAASTETTLPRLVDVFGNPIDVPCTLETVRCLESLFTVQRGINTSDNVLCYFLRDLLASDS